MTDRPASGAIESLLQELGRALRDRDVTDERAIDEAREHLIDLVEDGVRRGLPQDAAEQEATRRFGAPASVAAQFTEGRSPMLARLLSVAAATSRALTLQPRRAVRVSLLLASPAMLFLLAVLLDEGFGISASMAPVNAIMATPGWREAFNLITPVIFLGGLALGVLLNALAIVRLDVAWRERQLVSSISVEPRVANVAFIGAATLMLTTLAGYAFVENFQRMPLASTDMPTSDDGGPRAHTLRWRDVPGATIFTSDGDGRTAYRVRRVELPSGATIYEYASTPDATP